MIAQKLAALGHREFRGDAPFRKFAGYRPLLRLSLVLLLQVFWVAVLGWGFIELAERFSH